MTIQTAVLIETLADLGATVRWASCNIFSTQDHAAAAIAAAEDSGVCVEGRNLEEYWWCTLAGLSHGEGKGPQLIVDDGGDATLLIHKGYELEERRQVGRFRLRAAKKKQVIKKLLKDVYAETSSTGTRW